VPGQQLEYRASRLLPVGVLIVAELVKGLAHFVKFRESTLPQLYERFAKKKII
jgi:hypothetical protein